MTNNITNSLVKKITDYWNRQPCNVNHSQAELGSAVYFIEHARKRYLVEPHIDNIAQFKLYKNKRVLEVGCGIGADGANYAYEGADYLGIDLSENSINLARQRFKHFELPGEFKVLDAADTKNMKKLGTFDLVYSFGVIHHYPNKKKIIKNIHNALNKDGDLRFMVYAKNSWKWAMIQAGLDQFESQANCPYAEVYTPADIPKLLGPGFDVISIQQAHCFMYNVPLYKQGIYELEPWFKAMPERMIEAVKTNLGWHLLVHAKKR